MDGENEDGGPPSPAQSTQESVPNSAGSPASSSAGREARDEDVDEGGAAESSTSGASGVGGISDSGADGPQPGPSSSGSYGASRADDGAVGDDGPQPGPSSSSVSSGVLAESLRSDAGYPDESGHSGDPWATSSSSGMYGDQAFPPYSHEEDDDDDDDDGVSMEAAGSEADAGLADGGRALSMAVSEAQLLPQPSSSGASSAGQEPATASSSENRLAFSGNGGVSSAGSLTFSGAGAATSSSSTARANLGGAISSTGADFLRQGARAESSSSAGPIHAANSPSSFQHGEISNPPSPLGGSRPTEVRGVKRSFPDSPVPGPSGVVSPKVSRQRFVDDPVPGTSGIVVQAGPSQSLGGSAGEGGSAMSSSGLVSEAGGDVDWADEEAEDDDGEEVEEEETEEEEEDGLNQQLRSPLAPPLTPADNFMISSSTGLESVPATPVDVHGDNDLSVPSPRPMASGVGPANVGNTRRFGQPSGGSGSGGGGLGDGGGGGDDDDDDGMIDSTVDSTGVSMVRENSQPLDYSDNSLCQSSRLFDSDDDEAAGQPTEPTARPRQQQHQGSEDSNSITTSGQVDEGQFRLVPNDPEDDYYNQRHPPLPPPPPPRSLPHAKPERRSIAAAQAPFPQAPSPYDNPQPGPSRQSQPWPPPTTAQGPSLPPNGHARSGEAGAFQQNQVNHLPADLSLPSGLLESQAFPYEDSHPLDLEHIQLQRFPPSDVLPPTGGQDSLDDQARAKLFLLPDISLVGLKPEREEIEQGSGQANGGAGAIGSEPKPGPSGQHASILESMSGPLSKRLRTLHNLQQQESQSRQREGDVPPVNKRKEDEGPQEGERQAGDIGQVQSQPPQLTQPPPPPVKDSGNNGNGNGDADGGDFPGCNPQAFACNVVTLVQPESLEPRSLFPGPKTSPSDVWLEDDVSNKSPPALARRRGLGKRVAAPAADPFAPDEEHATSPLSIADAPVLSRARATLPTSHLTFKDSTGASGVLSKRYLPAGCRFGPVEGVHVPGTLRRGRDGEPSFWLRAPEGDFVELDTSDDGKANWMKFVRMADESSGEANVMLVQEGDKLFFVALRPLAVGQELLLGYSQQYALARGLSGPIGRPSSRQGKAYLT